MMAIENHEPPGRPDARERARIAASLLACMFEKAGWHVRHDPSDESRPDLVVRRKRIAYAVEIKTAPEGRSDRLVPLFAQAVLESARAAGRSVAPLAVVAAPKISQRVAGQVIKFAEDHAPDAAAGVIDFEGLAMFRGPHLEEMNAQAKDLPSASGRRVRESGQLFSDLNQWML
jgi:hypothetical protein